MALFGTSQFKNNLANVSAKTYQEPSTTAPKISPNPFTAHIEPHDPHVARMEAKEAQFANIATAPINPVNTPQINSPVFGGGVFGPGLGEQIARRVAEAQSNAKEKALEPQTTSVLTTKFIPGPFGQPIVVHTSTSVPATTQGNAIPSQQGFAPSQTVLASITNAIAKAEADKLLKQQQAKTALDASTKVAEQAKKLATEAKAALDNLQAELKSTEMPPMIQVPGPYGMLGRIMLTVPAKALGLNALKELKEKISLAAINAKNADDAYALAKLNTDKKAAELASLTSANVAIPPSTALTPAEQQLQDRLRIERLAIERATKGFQS